MKKYIYLGLGFVLASAVGLVSINPVLAAQVTCSLTTIACDGGNNTSSGPGVQGTSATGVGVVGKATNNIAIRGTSSSHAGVRGDSTSGQGLFGSSSSNNGVQGTTASGSAGVFGQSTKAPGVFGQSTNADGVLGQSTNNSGIYGYSQNNIGVIGYGAGNSPGVFAASVGGNGIESHAESGTAVKALSVTGNALVATTGGGVGAYVSNSGGIGADIRGSNIGAVARAPASGFPILATDPNGSNLFFVVGNGDVYYHGTLNHFASVRGGVATTYAATTTAPTVEDTGSAQLVNGQAAVPLDGAFAQTIDARQPYRVLLTPDGDTRGLFVAKKTSAGFVVREVQGGRGSFSFDYRVVGASLGHANERTVIQSAAAVSAPNAKPVFPHVGKSTYPKIPRR